jgi:hypothetical protein
MASTMQNPPADGQTPALLPQANAVGAVAATTEGHTKATAPPPRGTYIVGVVVRRAYYAMRVLVIFITGVAAGLYATSRVILVVLAFWSLSSIPATGHQSLEWSNLVPHL